MQITVVRMNDYIFWNRICRNIIILLFLHFVIAAPGQQATHEYDAQKY